MRSLPRADVSSVPNDANARAKLHAAQKSNRSGPIFDTLILPSRGQSGRLRVKYAQGTPLDLRTYPLSHSVSVTALEPPSCDRSSIYGIVTSNVDRHGRDNAVSATLANSPRALSRIAVTVA